MLKNASSHLNKPKNEDGRWNDEGQLHKKKIAEKKKRKIWSEQYYLMSRRRSVRVGVFVMVLLHNDDLCLNCALGYEDYPKNNF